MFDRGTRMQLIAHRVFADNRPFEPLSLHGGYHLSGVEMDVRSDERGKAFIDHAPVFQLRASRRRTIPKSLQGAVHYLANAYPDLDVLMLDVKSEAAAEAAGRYIAETPPPFRLVFNCWHGKDVAALRRYVPDAVVYFCIVPILARRIPKGRFRDLYVCNSFPFVSSRHRFEPKQGKTNRHNVNVKLLTKRRLNMYLPKGINGLCVHSMFCSDELADYAAEKGLGLSVYGLGASDRRRLDRISSFADYAIIGSRRAGRDRRTRNNPDSVM